MRLRHFALAVIALASFGTAAAADSGVETSALWADQIVHPSQVLHHLACKTCFLPHTRVSLGLSAQPFSFFTAHGEFPCADLIAVLAFQAKFYALPKLPPNVEWFRLSVVTNDGANVRLAPPSTTTPHHVLLHGPSHESFYRIPGARMPAIRRPAGASTLHEQESVARALQVHSPPSERFCSSARCPKKKVRMPEKKSTLSKVCSRYPPVACGYERPPGHGLHP